MTHKSRFARVRKEAGSKRGIQVVQWWSLKHQVSGQRQNPRWQGLDFKRMQRADGASAIAGHWPAQVPGRRSDTAQRYPDKMGLVEAGGRSCFQVTPGEMGKCLLVIGSKQSRR